MNYLQVTVLLTIYMSINSFASFKELGREFLKSNSSIKLNQFEYTKSKKNIVIFEGTNDWNVTFGYNNIDDNQDFFTRNFAASKKNENYSLSLAKKTFWGGAFEFSNSLMNTNQESTTFISAYETYEFVQGLSYTQDLGKDFFGKRFKQELDLYNVTSDYTRLEVQSKNENLLYNFYSQYIDCTLKKTLISLEERSLQRSKERLNQIKKQVRDGLKDKVDLYEAQISFHNSFERLEMAKKAFYDSLESLSTLLHRSVKENEIEQFNLESKENLEVVDGSPIKNNELLAMEVGIGKYEKALKKETYNVNPDVKLTMGYRTNRFEDERDDAISRGKLGEDKDYWELGVSVSFPLSLDAAKAKKSKAKIDLMYGQMNLRNTKKSLLAKEKLLFKSLERVRTSKNSAMKKRVLALKALKEKNKLYKLGRRDLNDLIQSEENLISTETTLSNLLATLKILMSKKALLYGKLNSFLGI